MNLKSTKENESKWIDATRELRIGSVPTPKGSAPTIFAAKLSISEIDVLLMDPDVSSTKARSAGNVEQFNPGGNGNTVVVVVVAAEVVVVVVSVVVVVVVVV